MKALTLTQPWATLVAIGAKTIETRSWGTSFRGSLAIHAARKFPEDARDLAFNDAGFSVPLHEAGYVYEWQLPLGAIVAVCEVKEVRRILGWQYLIEEADWPVERAVAEEEFGNYQPGRYAWHLASIRRLPKPIPCRGALGLWDVPAEIVEQLRAEAST